MRCRCRTAAKPVESASSTTRTGPRPDRRERRISTSASSGVHCVEANSAGASIGGMRSAFGRIASKCGIRSAATHTARSSSTRVPPTSASSRRTPASTLLSLETDHGSRPSPGRQSGWVVAIRTRNDVARRDAASASSNPAHPGFRATSPAVTNAERHQRIVHFVRRARFGPRLFAHAVDRFDVELAEIRRGRGIDPATTRNRLRAAFLERRVVEVRIRPRAQHFGGERRRLGQVARDDARLRRIRACATGARGLRCPSLRAGSRKASARPADDRESGVRRR